MGENICVYCSSSDAIAADFFEAAEELGALLARRKKVLVYGGGRLGLMGALARAVHQNGGRVVGVIPEALLPQVYEPADAMVVTRDMRERKAVMESRADAFIGLPGGFGTLEEVLETLTLKQLHFHEKPIVLINVRGFYDRLLDLFEYIYAEHFAKPEFRHLYHVAHNPAEALDYIETYRPVSLPRKWTGDDGGDPSGRGR
ncbi:MAG TPA: TIGR00730 family Rossman fold protein [Chloroflexi bacterium]|nr:TIGR00730 family Rossman fold protein [Chloroflexota bacterium]